MKLIGTDYDEFTGITEEFYYEENALTGRGKIHIKRYQDVEANINQNVEMYNSASKSFKQAGDVGIHQVADIPFVMIEQWKHEGRIDWFNSTHNERKKILNDSDLRKLRTRPGRI